MIVERLELEPSSLEELGLREVKMTGLGRFVALTGKNGAGKSRVLGAVLERIGARRNSRFSAAQVQEQIDDLQRQVARGSGLALFDPPESALQRLEPLARRLRELELRAALAPFTVNFVAVPLKLSPPNGASQEQCRHAVDFIRSNWVTSSKDALKWIWAKHDAYFNLSHPDVVQQYSLEAAKAQQDWQQLKGIIVALLGQPLTVEPVTRELLLFNRPAHDAQLSNGQNVLLQLAVALHAHSASLDNTVLFMDEPENHLHPSAVIDVLERLKDASKQVQFWIATHSVPLLAYLHAQDAKCLWYVEDGRVQHAGKLQQHVLESLLGNTERLEQLRTFVALPEQVAIEQFATECLLPPGVSDRGKGDPQVQQISGVIETLRAERNRPLEVLDYGAGRGRLLAGMFADNASDFRDRISYRALDEYPNGREDCVRVIESVYGSSEGRYFSELNKFDNDRRVPVDLLVLCNVLHEMPPEDWQRRFGAGNDFARMLAPDGFLLVVEDQEIHVGEHAHKYGFLLLDTAELRALFAVEQRDIDEKRFVVTKHPKRGDRLKAHWIAASLVERVTHDTVVAALTLLKKRSCDEINRLRSQPGGDGKQNGQAHARAAMLFANASLALDARGKS